jgi:outer membrane protein OmpA-like peptidoglycan-associated protein/Tol biopolymer transport system component
MDLKLFLVVDKRYLAILLCILVTGAASGQSLKEIVSQGDKLYEKKDYKKALELYLNALDGNPDDASVNLKIGLSFLYSETKSKAAKYISKAYRLNPDINDEIDYHLGIAFQNTNEFLKAIDHFQQFKKKKSKLASIADKKIAECRIADSLSQYELNVIIENMGPLINTPYNEYAPIISSDGNTLIFTSNRTNDPAEARAGKNYEDIYVTTRTSSGWNTPQKISSNINQRYNDAAASLSPDGKTLFLYYEEGAGDIYISKLEGTQWSKPSPLNKNINTSLFWETSASISADGKKLYFASNRPDGVGELDIYVSELDSKGDWGKAVNLGPIINTEENEDAPFIHPDGVTLFFSSDGRPTLGNSDIYVSQFINGKWRKPENIGYPINTWEYDGFFTTSADKKKGYYSTLKEGGLGEADIYSITFLEPKYKPKPKPVVVAVTPPPANTTTTTTASAKPTTAPPVNERPKTEAPKTEPAKPKADFVDPSIQKQLEMKVVTVLKGKVIDETTASPLGATISLVDNETKKVVSKITTNPTTGDFELVIPHGGNYGVATEKEGYLFNSINFNLPKFAEYQEIDTHIIMVKAEVGSKVVLKNIFFDSGKAELKSSSISEVEKIQQLLTGRPELKVQINGHTDNTGNPTTNKALSLKRASSVVDYLVTHGISATRLSAKGFGSEHPIVSNDDELGGREINRRTEIEIIGDASK